jgi:hypothetical protein
MELCTGVMYMRGGGCAVLRCVAIPSVCGDSYHLCAGKGKFSTVFRGIRKSDGEMVALKRIQIFDMMNERSRWVSPGWENRSSVRLKVVGS